MKARYFLGVIGLSACQLIFDPTEKLFLETFGDNCFDEVDNDGKNGADCQDPACFEACNDEQLSIETLTSNNCTVATHDVVGGVRGGLVVNADHIVINGNGGAASFSTETFEEVVFPIFYDGLFSDLRSGKIYTMLDDVGPIQGPSGSATRFQEIEAASGVLIGSPTTLTQPIPMGGVGVFSGKGRVVLASLDGGFDVNIETGEVTLLGALPPLNHQECNNKGFWGVAELAEEQLSLVYASSNKTITRLNLSTGEESILSGFGHLGDMCSISVAPREGRWYFQSSGATSFSEIGKQLGYCDATFAPGGVSNVCGDGVAVATEQCDDGNNIDDDGCTGCVIDTCGDGAVNQQVQGFELEACDDGNNNFGDGCRGDCLGAELCGDGLFDPATERCDDGNSLDGDGCESDCQFICADSLDPKAAFLDTSSGHCYAIPGFFDVWQSVRNNCVALGGDLVSITTATEQALINPASAHGPWIGLNDLNTEGDFTWSSGEALSFTNFAPAEPNDSGGIEDCVGLFPDGTWNDFPCNEGGRGLCEFDCNANNTPCQ